jgi:hypothetical protein
MKRRTGLAAGAALALAPLIYGGSLAAAPPPNGGTIAIETKTDDGDDDPATHSFVDAASEALTAKGFTVFDDPAHAAYVAELTLSRAAVGTGMAKVPGDASVSAIGTGLVVPLSTGASSLATLERTRLEIRIRKRGEDGVVWDGTAVTVRTAGTRKGTEETVASALSQALLRSYPAEPTDVVGVP